MSPSMRVASTNRTSPPVPVTARPVATPGTAILRGLLPELLPARRVAHECQVDRNWRGCVIGGDLRRRLAEQPELALELADAGLAGVLGHDGLEHRVVDFDLLLAQPVSLALSRPR